MAHEKLLCPPAEKANREIANQAIVAEYLSEFVKSGKTRITESVLLEIHQLTIQGIYGCAGHYRDALTKIEITDTEHKPSHASQVRLDVRDTLDWLYGIGKDKSPIERAAYLLWRVNYIHPFNGGNGRVARSMAYLVMVFEVAPIFAGEPLPRKLKARKAEYVAALKAADKGDLRPLEQLVLECFQAQLADISKRPQVSS